MAMTLRLTDEENEALRQAAEDEHRSMQDVARQAIREYTARREVSFAEAVDFVVQRDAELIERLGQ
ncbi:ribbon-helix-helix protein, CopG family [Saccharopolyspora dendranthemae]|uniref:Ribbon-helix-helix CopG family protein n=1 Tax=Saccharopolyspora dendranthemae TaxID=1181886 RepID=A0A561TWY9_9PSEU|nr:ribbon-helix-helix protein, CopG family [Saccharopolyspora dendranthemae]TWF91604.1 ribbon-helix-helix CopG family protein [Saccharopolyspora dendranthemae]